MCGLVGISSTKSLKVADKEMFTALLYIDTLRGVHSTGMFSVDGDKKLSVLKRAVDGPMFVDLRSYSSNVENAFNIRTLAGHNRHATRGRVNAENAHPFEQGAVTMMHNGTLRSEASLENGGKFGTDSECIAYNLSIVPPEDAGKAISKLHGAFALCWYDKRDDSLNFIRNKERPLHLTTDVYKTPSKVMWASERAMLQFVIERSRDVVEHTDIFLLEAMTHVKLIKSNKGDFYDWNYKKYDAYVPPKVVKSSGFIHGRTRSLYQPKGYPEKGSIVEMTPYQFDKYTPQRKRPDGVITGFLSGMLIVPGEEKDSPKYVDVHVHAIEESIADAAIEEGNLKVSINNYSRSLDLLYASIVWTSDKGTGDQDENAESVVFNSSGREISMKEFERLTDFGCSWCACDLTPETTAWSHNGGAFCPACAKYYTNGGTTLTSACGS